MRSLDLIDLPNFTSANLKEFAIERGWTVKDKESDKSIFFSPRDVRGDRLKFILPNERSEDFTQLAAGFLRGLSIVEKCDFPSAVELFKDYLSDNLIVYQPELRLKFGDAFFKSVSLQNVEQLSRHIRLTIAHAIDCEITPVLYRNRPSNRASNLSEEFEVSQQTGSYIFVVRCPRRPVQQHFRGFQTVDPIHVRSLVRLAKGISWLRGETPADDFRSVEEMSSYGLNANMAEHLRDCLNSIAHTEKMLLFNFNSSTITEQQLAQTIFKIGSREMGRLDQVYKTLSAPRTVSLAITVKIVRLTSKNPLQASVIHKIGATIMDGDFKDKHLTLDLSVDQYSKAIEAHSKGEMLKLIADFQVQGSDIKIANLISLT